MSGLMKLALALALLTWAAVVGILFSPVSDPITFPPPGEVFPVKVRAGQVVTISRNLKVHRQESVIIIRTMIKGDCARATCKIIDLQLGQLMLPVGNYSNIRREHTIPVSAEPGLWRLVFSAQWEDRLGRRVTKPLPELLVEVIQ